VRRVTKRCSSRVCTDAEIESDDRAQPCSNKDVQPGREATLDATELGLGHLACRRDPRQRKPGREARIPQFDAQVCEQTAAAAGSAGGVRLGHVPIVTRPAYRPINGAATIAS